MSGQTFDDAVLDCFLENQEQLFSERVAETREEAEYFLEDSMAQVVQGPKQVMRYFEESGTDLEGVDESTVLEEAEVFDVGDGRYLIVEG